MAMDIRCSSSWDPIMIAVMLLSSCASFVVRPTFCGCTMLQTASLQEEGSAGF